MRSSKILDGRSLANGVLAKVKAQVDELFKQQARPPALAVIVLGENSASLKYIKNKIVACTQTGITHKLYQLSQCTSQEQLIELIESLNIDSQIDAILVQLPLPNHIDKSKILDSIVATKDVDGFHSNNMGKLVFGIDSIYPCTVLGIIAMLDSINLDYFSSHIVIVGRSNIVGKPLAIALINRGATVTSCNSHTKNLASITSQADVVIVATGVPKLISRDHIAVGAIVIDVGINLLDNNLVGDVDFNAVIDKVSYITPVPGGVGPMTVAMLMQNTLKCYLL